jgi:hypothetical protein
MGVMADRFDLQINVSMCKYMLHEEIIEQRQGSKKGVACLVPFQHHPAPNVCCTSLPKVCLCTSKIK